MNGSCHRALYYQLYQLMFWVLLLFFFFFIGYKYMNTEKKRTIDCV